MLRDKRHFGVPQSKLARLVFTPTIERATAASHAGMRAVCAHVFDARVGLRLVAGAQGSRQYDEQPDSEPACPWVHSDPVGPLLGPAIAAPLGRSAFVADDAGGARSAAPQFNLIEARRVGN